MLSTDLLRQAMAPLAAVLVLALALAAAAWAVQRTGTNGPDTLRGTAPADRLLGLGGNDRIVASSSADDVDGGEGGCERVVR